MENDEVARFYNRSLLKGMIINLDFAEFCENFEKENDFNILLSIITDIISSEQEFFMLKNTFVYKIVSVLSEHYESSTGTIRELIEGLFEYFKKLSSIDEDDKNVLLSNYKAEYEYIRCRSLSEEEHLMCISNDSLLMKLLVHDDIDNIELDPSIIFSIDYILYSCPDFFKEENINKKTIKIIDKCFKSVDLESEVYRNAKEIKSDICKILKKEV